MNKSILVYFIIFSSINLALGQPDGIQKDLVIKANETAKKMITDRPLVSDPVMFNAQLVWRDDKKQVAVVMKVDVHYDWHIYAIVPPTQPYITSKLILDLPTGVSPIGKWEKPSVYPSSDDIYVYKGELVFIHYLSVDETIRDGKLNCGIYYQTCDERQCLPPQSKTLKLSL